MTSRVGPLRVSFVCQWFAPEPVTQPGWIVDGLRGQGLSVEVLTGIPNYPTGHVQEGYVAWRPQWDDVDGVPVRRAPLFPSHDRSAVRRLATYLSWAVSSTVVGWRRMRKADVVLVYSSPATAALGPMLQRLFGGTPYVLHLQDLWPDSVFASGFLPGVAGRLARRALTWLTSQFYRRASHIVVISPGMGAVLQTRGVPADRISLVYNWLPERPIAPSPADQPSLRARLAVGPDALVVMYAGNHGDAQRLDRAIHGVAMAARSGLLARPVHLVLVGDGVARPELDRLARSEAPDRVHLLGPVPRDVLESLMPEADVHLVSLADEPLFEVTLPSKVQSILAAGLPMLVCGAGDVARLVAEAGAGLVCPPADAEAFARAVGDLADLPRAELDRLGARGRAFYDEHMSEDVGASLMAGLLCEASGSRS